MNNLYIYCTQSFVACGWGISRIGYTMICFGISNAIAAAFAGGLAKCLGRFPMMVGTLVVHISLLVWMRLWVAVDSDYMTYFTMAAIWGLVDGVWLVQINCKSSMFIVTLQDFNIHFSLQHFMVCFFRAERKPHLVIFVCSKQLALCWRTY